MKKNFLRFVVLLSFAIVFFQSCTTTNRTMREPNVLVELQKDDFTLSQQVTAQATTTRYLGIDFERLFTKNTGEVEGLSTLISMASIPVVGNVLVDKTANYALFELMNANPGYDVVFYPQYEVVVSKPIFGIGILNKVTTVKTTARLAKLNN